MGCANLPSLEGWTTTTALVDTAGTRLGRTVAADAAANPGKTGIRDGSRHRQSFARATAHETFDNAVPRVAYEVRLGPDGRGLQWVERTAAGETRYDTEPESSLFLRLRIDLLELLPIEWFALMRGRRAAVFLINEERRCRI